MGIFDGYQFAPQGYSGQGGGLLDVLRMMQSVPTTQPQGFPQQQDALPPQAQPVQGAAPPQMQRPQMMPLEPGIGDHFNAGIKSFLGNLHGGPIAAIAGGLGGLVTGDRNDPYGEVIKVQNQTVRALISRGVNPQEAVLAASNPDMMKALLPRLWPTYTPHNVANTTGAFNPATGEFKPSYTAPKYEKLGPGDNLVAIGGGGQATQVASGGPEKPPAGYSYADPKDPSKGLTTIPGGPATHLPAETAGRVAMMETAVQELPKARDVLMKDRTQLGTGVTGTLASKVNVGDTGRAQRTVRLAIEGALRAMTGAAAPEAEVNRYENLFLPSPFDSAQTATQKLNQLDDFISNARRLVTQGRGGTSAPGRPSDPLGIR